MRYLAKATVAGGLVAFAMTPALAEEQMKQEQMQSESMKITTPSDLKWSAVPSLPPGAQIAVIEGPLTEAVPFTFRAKLPANYTIPAHWHPAIEHVTVLSGTFNLGMGAKVDRSMTQALGPGGIAIMQPGTRHFVWTDQETIIQVHGMGPWALNYVNPADDPRQKATTGSQ